MQLQWAVRWVRSDARARAQRTDRAAPRAHRHSTVVRNHADRAGPRLPGGARTRRPGQLVVARDASAFARSFVRDAASGTVGAGQGGPVRHRDSLSDGICILQGAVRRRRSGGTEGGRVRACVARRQQTEAFWLASPPGTGTSTTTNQPARVRRWAGIASELACYC